MKDYSLTKEDRKEFILSYKIKGDKICLKLPRKRGFFNFFINLFKKNGYDIPYTEENEQKVIEKMKVQAEKGSSKELESVSLDYALIFYICFIVCVLIGALFNISTNYLPYILLVLIWPFKKVWEFDFFKRNDLEKSKFFLENEEEINANLNKPNVLLNVSRKTVAKVEEVKASGKPFNINDIDKLPLKDLKQLKANIDRIMSFGFEEETTTIEQGFQKIKQ